MHQLLKNTKLSHPVDKACFNYKKNTLVVNNPVSHEISSYNFTNQSSGTAITHKNHYKSMYDIVAMDLADNGSIVIATIKGTIIVISENENHTISLNSESMLTCIKWESSSQKFAVGTSGGYVYVVHYSNRKEAWAVKSFYTTRDINCLAWDDTGSLISVGTVTGQVKSYIATNKFVKTDANDYGQCIGSYESSSWIYDIVFLKKSLQIVTCTRDCRVIFIDIKEGTSKEVTIKSNIPLHSLHCVKSSSLCVSDFNGSVYFLKFIGDEIIVKQLFNNNTIGEPIVALWKNDDNIIFIDRCSKIKQVPVK